MAKPRRKLKERVITQTWYKRNRDLISGLSYGSAEALDFDGLGQYRHYCILPIGRVLRAHWQASRLRACGEAYPGRESLLHDV